MASNVNSIRTIIINGKEKEDESFIRQYLFKLVPDFSVFDIAEKYFIDNNKMNLVDKLFFYGINISNIDFRRFIVKSKEEITVIPTESGEYFIKSYKIGECIYTIVIDECFKSGGFSVSSANSNVIGVCF